MNWFKSLIAAEAVTGVKVGATDTLAVADAKGEVQTLSASKEEFLRQGGEFVAVSSEGEPLKVSVVRPNYVNTAVRVTDAKGRELQPLVVRYPVEKGGKLKEVAYYTSAHPAVEDEEVVRAGGDYVRERLDEAARKLAHGWARRAEKLVTTTGARTAPPRTPRRARAGPP